MERTYRHSIFFPLLLISVGVIYLLNTLGYIHGEWWELFLKLWPLFFIIGGLDNIIMGRGYIWAVISIGLGAAFLLANFGYLQWSSLSLLLRFWPLLLIAAGLDLIFRGRSTAVNLIGVLLAVVLIGGVFWFALSGTTAASMNTSPISQALGNAKELSLQIDNATGRVEIRGIPSTTNALQGEITLGARETIDKNYAVQNGTGELSIHTTGAEFLPWVGGFGQPVWNFGITTSVPVEITIQTVVGDQQVDLRSFNLKQLVLSVAVGQINVILPEKGNFSGRLESPVGGINVRVPSGALVEFQTNGVFVAKTLSSGFTVSGDHIYSPGANSQNATMHITIDQPIGRLVLSELQQ